MNILNWLFDKNKKVELDNFKEESTKISYNVKLDMYMSVIYLAMYEEFRCQFWIRDYQTPRIIEDYDFQTRQFHIPETYGAESKTYIIRSNEDVVCGNIGHNNYIDLYGNHSGSKNELMRLCVNEEILYSIFKTKVELRNKVCNIILSELTNEFNNDKRDDVLIKELKNSLIVKDEEIMLHCFKNLLLKDKDDVKR